MTRDMTGLISGLSDLTAHFRPLQMRVMLGHADDVLVGELGDVRTRCEGLAQGAPQVVAEMATDLAVEILEAEARALKTLGRPQQAATMWRRALAYWETAGATARADACREALDALAETVDATPWDRRFVAGHRRVQQAPDDSVDRADALFSLAMQYDEAFETFDAFRYAEQAVAVLDRVTHDDEGAAAGDDVLAGLARLLDHDADTADFAALFSTARDKTRIHQLYSHALVLMANCLVDDDPARAQQYLAKARAVQHEHLDRESYLAYCRERYGHLLGDAVPPSMPMRLTLEVVDLVAEHRRPGSTTPQDRIVTELEAIASFGERIEAHGVRRAALVEAASVRRNQRRFDDALALLDGADDAHRRIRGADPPVRLLQERAEIETRRGHWADVIDACTKGVALVEDERKGISAAFPRSSILARGVRLYELGVLAAHQIGDTSRAVHFAELSKARGIARPARTGQERVVELRRRFDKTTADLQLARSGRGPHSAVTMERQLLWDALVASGGETLAAVPPLDDVRNALPAGCVAVSYYWVDPTLLTVTAVSGDAATMTTVPFGRAAQEALVAVESVTEDSAGDLEAALEQLRGVLFPKAVAQQIETAQRMFVSPHRRLHQVPFHALPVGDTPLLQRAAVSYVPNLSALCRPWRTRPAEAVLMGVDDDGHPDHARLDVEQLLRGRIADQCRRAGYRVHSATGRDCSAATLTALDTRGVLRDARLLFLIVHGTNLPSAHPFEAQLFLADRPVDGLDISQLDIRAEVAVIAACYSGRRAVRARTHGAATAAGDLPGDDQFGLAAALFAAGAQAVLGSMWRLSNDALRPILEQFARAVVAGEAPDVALREALVEWDIVDRAVPSWAQVTLQLNAGPFVGAA